MDVPSTVEALVVLVLVLAPGYIFIRTINRVITEVEEPPDLRFLVSTLMWGLLIHALLLFWPWWLHWIPSSDQILNFYLTKSLPEHAEEIARWALVALAIVPWVLGQITALILKWHWLDTKIMDRLGLSIVDRTPTAWQYVTNKELSAYVLIYLKDGRVVGGCYTGKSFTSNNPRHGDIYLETRCHLNDAGEFQYGISHSDGVWIAHDVISHVEFRKDVDFPTTNPKSTTRPESAINPEPTTDSESTIPSKARPKRRTRTSATRLIEAATAAALVQVLWRMMNRIRKL